MLHKKIRKLLRDPKLFISDMALKHGHKLGAFQPKKYDGQYHYTVVSAVYNVGRYLDDYFNSLVNQRLDFRSHIHLVLVDDGSTDDSALIIQRWQRKYPDNITYIFKENGGQASTRNRGLQAVNTEWVTFIDPDDFVDQNYFFEIDNYVKNNEIANLKLISCNFIFYFEKNKQLKDTHPLKYRYEKSNSYCSTSQLGKKLQLSVAHAIFKTEIIAKENLKLDERIKPSFEDANFVAHYFKAINGANVAFLKSAKYYYRKREDGTSTLDTAWEKSGIFDEVLHYGCLDAIQQFSQNGQEVPVYLQRTVLYHLIWYLKSIINHPEKIAFLSEQQKNKFEYLLREIFAYIDDKTIMEFELAGCWFFHKVGMLWRYKQIQPNFQIAYVSQFDEKKNLVQLRYFTGMVGLEQISLNKTEILPAYVKTIRHDFSNQLFISERLLWVPLTQDGILQAKIGDIPTRLSMGAKQYSNGVDSHAIRQFFLAQRPQYRQSAEYRHAWLLMDRDTWADDNAEHLYRYIRQHDPQRKLFFVLRQNSHDWARLQQDGFALLPYGSPEHEAALMSCAKLISSHADKYVTNHLGNNMMNGRHFIFLQHGIIKDDLSGWLNQKEQIDCFVTATSAEFTSITQDHSRYKFGKKEVVLSGLPRHDRLLNHAVPQEKLILFMPTWRIGVVGNATGKGNERSLNDEFMHSDFARHWQAVLQHPRLHQLCADYGYRVLFMPHANIQPYLSQFVIPANIDVVTHRSGSIQSLFQRAAMMVTDYSSVAFEMAIQDKPVLYYQFDEHEVFNGGHTSAKGYFDYRRDGFGPVVTEEEPLFDALQTLLDADCQPDAEIKARIARTFLPRDGKNCERVYQAIVALDQAHDPALIDTEIMLDYAQQASRHAAWPLATARWNLVASHATPPQQAMARLPLAQALREQGRLVQAGQCLDARADEIELNPDFTRELARLAMARHDWSAAAAQWRQLPWAQPADRLGHLQALSEQGDSAAITPLLADCAFSRLELHHQVLARAWHAAALNAWAEVEVQLASSIDAYRSDELHVFKPQLLLARAYRMLADFAAAHQQLSAYEQHTPNDPACRQEIACLAFAQGAWAKVVAQLNQSVSQLNELPAALAVRYVQALRQQKKLDSLQTAMDLLLAQYPHDATLQAEAGESALLRKDWPTAASYWLGLLTSNPDAPYKLAQALRMQGETESALQILQRTSVRAPANAAEWQLKAELAQLSEQWDVACLSWRALLRAHPEEAPNSSWERLHSAQMMALSSPQQRTTLAQL